VSLLVVAFEGRFKSTLVQKADYLMHCVRYIELNPVRAGMTNDPGNYNWSSYKCHAFGKGVKLHILSDLALDPVP